MNKLFRRGVALYACLALASCQNEEIQQTLQGNNLSVEAMMAGGSRTMVSGNGEVTWTANDAMLVFGDNVYGTLTLDAEDAGKKTGTFSGTVYGAANNLKCAVYGTNVAYNNGTATFELDEVNFPNSNSPMVATWNTSGTLQFQHLCAMVRLNIVDLPEDAEVSITGTGIGGTATVDLNGTLNVDEIDSERTITVKGAEALKNIDIPVFAGSTITKVAVAGKEYTLENGGLTIEYAGQLNASGIPTLKYDETEGLSKVESTLTLTDLSEAVNQSNAVVYLEAGEYTFPKTFAEGVTVICNEGTVFTGTSKGNINGATIIGATFSNPSGTAMDETINGTFKNCVFEGNNGLRWCYAGETVVFEDCVFSGSVYGAHFDGGANDVIFRNCTFSGFNAFGGAITQLTLENCTFKSNGLSDYNGVNLWGNTKMTSCEFAFDGSVGYEWVDICNSNKTCEFELCTINGQPIEKNDVGAYTDKGYSTLIINGESYICVETMTGLNAAITALNNVTFLLTDGTYEGMVDLTGKELNIEATNKNKATINGLVWANNCTVTLKGLKLTNPSGVQHPNPSNSQYYNSINDQYPLIGAYNNAAITVEECTLDLTAPTIYGFYGYAHNTPVFKNSIFNCNKICPIANNGDAITVTGCTFNDQYHYSLRLFENAGERQTVIFTNNTIQGSNDKGEFEGINISKKGGTATIFADFTIKGNTDVKYRHHKQVTMDATCTYDTDIKDFAFEKEQ